MERRTGLETDRGADSRTDRSADSRTGRRIDSRTSRRTDSRTRRRSVLAACGSACAGPLLSGCLGPLRRDDAWRELVQNPPDGVYVPSKRDEMISYGQTRIDGHVVSVAATRPHSFWTPTGTDRTRADLRSSHDLHLMVSAWDAETGTVVPLPVTAALSRADEVVDEQSLWPMLSQRMGFHYGDNVSLDGDGTYAAELRLGPSDARSTGDGANRFEATETVTLEFEYAAAELAALERTLIDADDGRGEPGALEPMAMDDHDGHGNGDDHNHHENEADHGDGDDHDGHTESTSSLPVVESLPGDIAGVETSDDVSFAVTTLDGFRGANGTYVVVSPRSRYNRYMLPLMSLSGTIVRDGTAVFDGALTETVDPELDHHYGTVVDSIEPGDELSLSVDAPPQLSLHEGYETAFLEPEPPAIPLAGDT